MISHPAVAVISAAILAYEGLLVRLFAVVQWHSCWSPMTISAGAI